MKRPMILVVLLLGGVVLAQESTSFKLKEHVFNAGGHPRVGVDLASTNFRISLGSIGNEMDLRAMDSASFNMNSSFVGAYPPPGEVSGLRFTDPVTLYWDPEQSAGAYNLYRDDTSDGFGNCEQQDLDVTTTTDPAIPTTNNTFYYLVTVENLLAEEGTKGLQSNSIERLGGTGLPVCP